MEIFEVIQPGAYTTVQDRGRFGYQQFGVPVCGVVDSFAYRLANALVGNRQQFSGLP
jgi:allophanate hydrolase subunit 2